MCQPWIESRGEEVFYRKIAPFLGPPRAFKNRNTIPGHFSRSELRFHSTAAGHLAPQHKDSTDSLGFPGQARRRPRISHGELQRVVAFPDATTNNSELEAIGSLRNHRNKLEGFIAGEDCQVRLLCPSNSPGTGDVTVTRADHPEFDNYRGLAHR
jgi:hypothetical protein